MSDQEAVLKHAIEKGYTVDADGTPRNPSGVVINGCLNRNGYRYLTMRMDKYFGCRKCGKAYIHRLVAYQKYGEAVFNSSLEVRHLDGDRLNNSYKNIDIGTHSTNCFDIPRVERVRCAKIAAATQRKLNDADIRALRADRAGGLSYKYLMEKYSLAKSTISYIVNNKTYTDVGGI